MVGVIMMQKTQHSNDDGENLGSREALPIMRRKSWAAAGALPIMRKISWAAAGALPEYYTIITAEILRIIGQGGLKPEEE